MIDEYIKCQARGHPEFTCYSHSGDSDPWRTVSYSSDSTTEWYSAKYVCKECGSDEVAIIVQPNGSMTRPDGTCEWATCPVCGCRHAEIIVEGPNGRSKEEEPLPRIDFTEGKPRKYTL